MKTQTDGTIESNPKYAYLHAKYFLKNRFPEGEESISKNPYTSYEYAKDILKGRFELGESTIAQDSDYAFLYARDVLEGRFELGEEAIAQSPYYAFFYAWFVTKGRFKAGEAAIAQSAEYAYLYARDILKGRFELGEKAIAQSAEYAFLYAINILNDRFELGEKAIAQAHKMPKYINFLLKTKKYDVADFSFFYNSSTLICEYISHCVEQNKRDLAVEKIIFELHKSPYILRVYLKKVRTRLHEYEDQFFSDSHPTSLFEMVNYYSDFASERIVGLERERFETIQKKIYYQNILKISFNQFMPKYIMMNFSELLRFKRQNIFLEGFLNWEEMARHCANISKTCPQLVNEIRDTVENAGHMELLDYYAELTKNNIKSLNNVINHKNRCDRLSS